MSKVTISARSPEGQPRHYIVEHIRISPEPPYTIMAGVLLTHDALAHEGSNIVWVPIADASSAEAAHKSIETAMAPVLAAMRHAAVALRLRGACLHPESGCVVSTHPMHEPPPLDEPEAE